VARRIWANLFRIVETGNITRAAEQFFVAQPALGRRIQIPQLEEEFEVSLLSRHSDRLLTEPAQFRIQAFLMA